MIKTLLGSGQKFSSLKKVGRLTKFHVFKLQKSLTLISSRNKRLNLGWAYPTTFLSQIIHPIDNGFALTNLCVPDVHQLIYLFAKDIGVNFPSIKQTPKIRYS
jgi:hypothetical protein